MTVRRTLELRVGDCRKSTRHRYSPSSRSSTLFSDRVAGSVTVRKYPRSSRISLSFQCKGTSECFPRTSKLWTKDNVNHSVKITCVVFCWHVYVLAGVYFVWPWKSCEPHRIRDVTPGPLSATDTCIVYHVMHFEVSRSFILHTRYVSTCVAVRVVEGVGKQWTKAIRCGACYFNVWHV
jgi:hypothetical protein